MPPPFKEKILYLRVTAGAKINAIKLGTRPDGQKLIRVYVTKIPEHGKANKAVIQLLAEAWGLPPSRIEIIKGLTKKDKMIKIAE